MPPKNIDTQTSTDISSTKEWKQPVKQKAKTVMPDSVKIQVHQRQSPPDSYRICNGTSFEPYQPKAWGR